MGTRPERGRYLRKAAKPAGGPAWFKRGHKDSTANMLLCLGRGRRGVAMLANGAHA